MKVIVTGGAGFIGSSAIKNFLKNGDDVLNVDKLTYASNRKNTSLTEFIQLDISESSKFLDVVTGYKPDLIVNFAAETHVDNSIENCKEFIKSNVEGTASVLDACRRTNTRLCHISTDEVYGPASSYAFTEKDPVSPMNPYSATKAAADMLVQSYRNTYGLNFIIVRPSNNYGKNQHNEKFIPKLISCIRNKQVFPLYGSGNQEREWTYVEDTARKIRSLLIHPETEWNSIYNLSSNVTFRNIETARLIIGSYNKIMNTSYLLEDIVKTSADRLGHDKKYWIDSSKLNKFVGFDYTSFEEGIEETIRQYE